MRRRSFLRAAGTVGAATAASAFGILRYPRGARAAGWGAWPSDKDEARTPADRLATNVLELHINGGLNPWDTFYTVPDWGADEFTYVHQFAPDAGNFGGQPNRDARFAACGYDGPLWVDSGISDGNGVPLSLGPWATPFRNRPDILARMRVVVMRHGNVAHEGANPLSFTGDSLGQPRLAGIGTTIQRYFSENPEAGGGQRATPYAYVLYPGLGFSTFNSLSASAVGFHPGSARPLGVTVAPNSALTGLLARTGPYDRASFDAAITYYRQEFEARFRTGGLGAPARSLERSNYEYADFARRHAPDLQAVLTADQFDPIAPPAVGMCNAAKLLGQDMPRMQARLAANLLTRETDQARYVLWIDTGISPHPNGGHDSHTVHTAQASLNLPHTLQALTEIIAPEGSNDPSLIDLDRTMIVINTEFGRTPYRQPEGGETGTNHWPWGYVNIVIGGPVRTPGSYGYINYEPGGAEDGYAVEYLTPAENRMMVLQSMGIYPFSSQSFAVGDVRGGVANELDAALRVRDLYLGLG